MSLYPHPESTGDELSLVRQYVDAVEAMRSAEKAVEEYFCGACQSAETKEETLAIFERMPSCVAKAFLMDLIRQKFGGL